MAKKQWIDETGLVIPASRVTKSEKLRETVADTLLKKAMKLNSSLVELKNDMAAASDEVFAAVIGENGGTVKEDRKGNFLFYNFDRSIKIERDIQDRIEFDDALIAVSKQHFDEFLQSAQAGVDEMIRSIVLEAFNTSKGRLDTQKVLSLLKYRQRVPADKYPAFHAALDAIEKAIRRPDSKSYHRISVRNKEGKYDAVNLNFSSI